MTWQPIKYPPASRIRVLGGSDRMRIVVGDIFFGEASMLLSRLGDAEYIKERGEPAWRYTQGEDRVEDHFLPTHWMPLPPPPGKEDES